jgi:hypothetical protein
MTTALLGCAATPVHFGAPFNQPDGLGPGDPVRHGTTSIGSVSAISPTGDGSAQVTVQVDNEYAGVVRADSILILQNTGSNPTLELMSPNTFTSVAADGAQLYGASNEDQTQMLASILGPQSIGNSYAQFVNRYSSPQASPSPGASVLQNQLMTILQQTLAAATALSSGTQPGRAQMDQFRENASVVERQLEAHGRTAEAAQLRAEIAQFNAAAATSGTAPNTLTVPRATPTP